MAWINIIFSFFDRNELRDVFFTLDCDFVYFVFSEKKGFPFYSGREFLFYYCTTLKKFEFTQKLPKFRRSLCYMPVSKVY